jgi:poly(A) polymerase
MPDAPESLSRPLCRREDAVLVVQRLREAGHVAYFAGGCVRDLLLGLTPKDYDVATDAPPPRVREIFKNTQAVGAAFGVILVRLNNSQIEVATFRRDLEYEDGRHPTGVKFTSAEEDARRRDFTINGLFYDPVEEQVIDFVGGQEDLKNKILRAIGEPEERFREDHLRLLRAVRFAARFDLRIEDRTAHAIAHRAEHLKRISPERVGEELRLMLMTGTRAQASDMLWRFKLIPVIFRALPEQSTEPRLRMLSKLPATESISFGLALAALSLEYRWKADISLFTPAEVRRTAQACRTTLKISNDESDRLAGVLSLAELFQDTTPTVATMKRFLARDSAADARRLLDALRASGLLNERIDWLRQKFEELEKTDVAPPPLLTGDDLIAAGFKPGKSFKQILNTVYDAQLEQHVKSKDEAMKLAMELGSV